eukprot:365667-Chlamydomonas_euryale.AAC.8
MCQRRQVVFGLLPQQRRCRGRCSPVHTSCQVAEVGCRRPPLTPHTRAPSARWHRLAAAAPHMRVPRTRCVNSVWSRWKKGHCLGYHDSSVACTHDGVRSVGCGEWPVNGALHPLIGLLRCVGCRVWGVECVACRICRLQSMAQLACGHTPGVRAMSVESKPKQMKKRANQTERTRRNSPRRRRAAPLYRSH